MGEALCVTEKKELKGRDGKVLQLTGGTLIKKKKKKMLFKHMNTDKTSKYTTTELFKNRNLKQ